MTRISQCVLSVSLAIGAAGFAACATAGEFDEMVTRIPGQANVAVLVNAERVFQSEIAKTEGWQEQRGKRFESGLTFLPPKVTRAVIASQVDLEVFRPMWDVAVLEFPKAPSLDDVQEHYGGLPDKFADTNVLRVADDSYVVRLSDKLLGAFGPANRQLVARWLAQKDDELSPYLKEALGYADAGTEVLMAIDFTNVVTPALVEQRLAENENAEIKKVDPKQLVQIFSSLKGVMLGITFDKQAYGSIKVDFAEDVTPLAPVAKTLLLEVLANHGAMVDEFEEWKVETKGTTIRLSGFLGESGLMRITSLINLPTHAMEAPVAAAAKTPAKPEASPSDPQQVVLETTMAYYKSVDKILRDLKGRKNDARTMGQMGVWFGNYANKIDRLPILNVDERMLQYGQYVAQSLRNCSASVKGYGIQKRVGEVNADSNAAPFGGANYGYDNSGYGYGGGYYGRPYYGGVGAYGWTGGSAAGAAASNSLYWAGRSEMRDAMAQRTQVRTQLRAQTATQVQGIVEQLRQAHSQIRTEMTQKYQVEF